MNVEITFDDALCQRPRDCRQCLESCPQAVLMCYPKAKRTRGEPTTEWTITAAMKTVCTGCGICVEVCPSGAVKVAIHGPVVSET